MPAKSPRKRVTMREVAHLAGVSTKSVSRVMNSESGVSEETVQRIQNAIARLGYVANPAARRLRGSPRVIGLIVSGFEEYADEIMRGMSRTAQHSGYNLVLYVQHAEAKSAEAYRTLIASGLISGVLMIVPFDDEVLMEMCNYYELPYVLIDYQGKPPDASVPTITVTNRKGVLEATRYLLTLGHRKIGFITGQMTMASARERLQGYRDGLAESGLPFDPSLVVEGDWMQKTGFTQAQLLLERHPDLTAIIGADDLTAFGVMDALKEAGLRIGEDVSVIGFDDIPMASNVHPTLSTVRQPMAQMGEAAVELLIALLEHRPPLTLQREFSTELVIRHSTGRPISRDREVMRRKG
jgi:LacI family transcriptional regulator